MMALGLLAILAGADGAAAQPAGSNTAQEPQLKSVQTAALQGAEKDRFVAAHNAARKAVKVAPLAWSDEASRDAADWLAEEKDRLIQEAKAGWAERKFDMPHHRNDGKYGENIAGWAGTRVPGAERAIAFWLTEKAAFDKLNADGAFKYGDQDKKTEPEGEPKQPIVIGHYTALVWSTTTHVGAAKLVFHLADERGVSRTYVAVFCNYSPPGNIRGQKPF
jgi:pathogenesis-related protein 1